MIIVTTNFKKTQATIINFPFSKIHFNFIEKF